jgi:hypothetical protein
MRRRRLVVDRIGLRHSEDRRAFRAANFHAAFGDLFVRDPEPRLTAGALNNHSVASSVRGARDENVASMVSRLIPLELSTAQTPQIKECSGGVLP